MLIHGLADLISDYCAAFSFVLVGNQIADYARWKWASGSVLIPLRMSIMGYNS
jgi:hypothetical protein